MKVYVVTSGAYSDYTIQRIFLDKKKAEYWVATQNMQRGYITVSRNIEHHRFPSVRLYDYRIEEYETSCESVEPSGSRQVVYLYTPYSDGEPIFGTPETYYEEDKMGNKYYEIKSSKKLGREKVKKIVQDMKTEYQAKKAGWI